MCSVRMWEWVENRLSIWVRCNRLIIWLFFVIVICLICWCVMRIIVLNRKLFSLMLVSGLWVNGLIVFSLLCLLWKCVFMRLVWVMMLSLGLFFFSCISRVLVLWFNCRCVVLLRDSEVFIFSVGSKCLWVMWVRMNLVRFCLLCWVNWCLVVRLVWKNWVKFGFFLYNWWK